MSFLLLIDNDFEISLRKFLGDNSAEDVTPLPEEDIKAIKALKVGEKHVLNLGAGGLTTIERIEPLTAEEKIEARKANRSFNEMIRRLAHAVIEVDGIPYVNGYPTTPALVGQVCDHE